MRNKILEIFSIIIIIIGLLFIINFIRNFIILRNIYNLSKDFDNSTNYYVEINTTTLQGNSRIEEYYRDGLTLTKFITNNKIDYIIWHNNKDGEIIYLKKDEDENIVQIDMDKDKMYFYINSIKFAQNNSFGDILIKNLFNIIKTDKNAYKIKTESYTEYINKDTGLVEKLISEKNNVNIQITYIENKVTVENVNKPENF